jgi:hypothetical protein
MSPGPQGSLLDRILRIVAIQTHGEGELHCGAEYRGQFGFELRAQPLSTRLLGVDRRARI